MWLSDEVVDRLREVTTRPELPADRYELRRPLGRGGMGAVYAAYDRLLDREVAVKISHAAAAASRLDERLREEARIMAGLEHPGIVPVHDAGVLGDGRLFYVMKLVRGQTLADQAASLTTEPARLAVFERIAETVAFAHSAGVVHRDLQPANVMVGSFGEVLVVDWGVARVLRLADAEAGALFGTPGFMAPEQLRREPAVGAAADVYALGALLFWMLTATTAAPDAAAVDHRLKSMSPAPSRRLRAIVAKCLAADPAARYPTAAGLVADLARYRDGAAVEAHRETFIERAGRALQPYRAFILLVLAYLVMRTMFALWMSRP